MSPAIRDARPDDLATIVDIYNATIPSRQSTADLEPVTVESRRDWFESHSPDRHPLWVAEVDGRIAAWLGLGPWNRRPAYAISAEIGLYVHTNHRRQGLGRTLLARAIERAPGLGLRTLLGVIFAHNEPSVALFERFGFEAWGRLPGVTEMDGIERDVVILGLRV